MNIKPVRKSFFFIRPGFGIYQASFCDTLDFQDLGDGIYVKGCAKRAYYLSEQKDVVVTIFDYTKAYSRFESALADYPSVCPEKGSFVAYKKVMVLNSSNVLYCNIDIAVAKLFVPSNAKRVSSYGRKCRCDEAIVLEIKDSDGHEYTKAENRYYPYANFIYTVGKAVKVEDFCPDRKKECAPGIHFFMTEREAWFY